MSCDKNDNNILIYKGQYFQKNKNLVLNINDGDFIYEKKFKTDYIVDKPKLVKKYRTNKDSVNIHLTIDNRDTTLIIPSSIKKILFGNDSDGNLFIYTEKDEGVWLRD
jgi:hypothetical protein